MQTTFFRVLGATLLGATLIAATTVQMAGAAEHHTRKAHATAIQQFRNSNAYAAPVQRMRKKIGLPNTFQT